MTTDEATAKKTCFIIGPIGDTATPIRQLADWLLKGIIRPVLEDKEFSYLVKRADHDTNPGSITSSVIDDVINSDIVIADLTGFNPNAFYELGIRHAIRKPAIHIIGEAVKLPFDNSDQRTIFVNIADYESIEDAKARLREAVRAVNREGYRVTNPVVQASAFTALKDSADPKDRIIANLESRLARLEQEKSSYDDFKRSAFINIRNQSTEGRNLVSYPARSSDLSDIIANKLTKEDYYRQILNLSTNNADVDAKAIRSLYEAMGSYLSEIDEGADKR